MLRKFIVRFFLGFGVLPVLAATMLSSDPEKAWRIGGKIHFEEKGGEGYIGLEDINTVSQGVLRKHLGLTIGSCPSNAKILLRNPGPRSEISFYEEKSKPGVPEEMHATLLYTQARGFCDSETIRQVCPVLFRGCVNPPMIETVAQTYDSFIKPDTLFMIDEVVLTEGPKGSSFIMMKLLHEGKERIYYKGFPVSAGLHMTLVNCEDGSLGEDQIIKQDMLQELNKALKGKKIKIGQRNGRADLELGFSGTSERLRAGEWVG